MAKLSEIEKGKILSDRLEGASIRRLAEKYNVSTATIQRVVKSDTEMSQKVTEKKKKNTAEILDYLDSRKEQAKDVLDAYIEALKKPEKIQAAKLSEIATAMGIVIDKFINNPMKHQLDKQKLEIELLKLESQVKDNQPEEEAEDNFMDALNGTAAEVWEESEVEEDE